MIAISNYSKMKSVPAGAILDSIIKQQKRSKVSVARDSDILPQRLNDLVMGNRRFTVETSRRLEESLNICDAGFFYRHQALHDVYLYELETKRQHHPDFSILTKTTFWDVQLEKVDWHAAQSWAIRRVLEYGDIEELQEMERFYSHEAVEQEYTNHRGSFRLPDKVERIWQQLEELKQEEIKDAVRQYLALNGQK
ncbi:MAG: XRE family transcriptional regulator [Bacteroidales bacterium]|nr:XRE family transcriptional regulator [Candidatus Liminaster caballi]